MKIRRKSVELTAGSAKETEGGAEKGRLGSVRKKREEDYKETRRSARDCEGVF